MYRDSFRVRQQERRFDVDLLAELAGGRQIGLEIKASAAPDRRAARHLATLRDRYPDTFLAGVVLLSGPWAYRLGDRLLAVPISTFWAFATATRGSGAHGRTPARRPSTRHGIGMPTVRGRDAHPHMNSLGAKPLAPTNLSHR